MLVDQVDERFGHLTKPAKITHVPLLLLQSWKTMTCGSLVPCLWSAAAAILYWVGRCSIPRIMSRQIVSASLAGNTSSTSFLCFGTD